MIQPPDQIIGEIIGSAKHWCELAEIVLKFYGIFEKLCWKIEKILLK